MEDNVNPKWANLVWTRTCIPRHTFTMWLFMQNRLPILQRIGRFTALPSTDCLMCKQCPETHEHLFFECPYAKEIWSMFCTEWGLQLQLEGEGCTHKIYISNEEVKEDKEPNSGSGLCSHLPNLVCLK